MAFQQFDSIPSMAPVTKRAVAPVIVPAPSRAVPPTAKSRRAVGGFATAALLAGGIVLIGYQATQALESLALGVMAADLVFLAAAALWSTFAGRRHR